MRSLAIAAMAAVLASLAAVPAAHAAGGPLDGKRFVGETGEAGKEKGEKEEFVFKDGTFDPLGCHQYGFTAAPYLAGGDGKTASFTAETKSPKEGIMKWSGTIQGQELKGTVSWIKEGRELKYWFKGTLQTAGATPPPPPPPGKDAEPPPGPGR